MKVIYIAKKVASFSCEYLFRAEWSSSNQPVV